MLVVHDLTEYFFIDELQLRSTLNLTSAERRFLALLVDARSVDDISFALVISLFDGPHSLTVELRKGWLDWTSRVIKLVLGESAVRRSTELLSTKIKYPAQIERIVNNEIMSMLDGSVIHSKAEMRTWPSPR
jgi:hypothetical protein